MAISFLDDTLSLLNRWQQIMEANEWLFNQVIGKGAPQKGRKPWVQGERQNLAEALVEAITDISELMHFWPTPRYIVGERIDLGKGSPFALQELKTKWGYVQAFGVRTTTAIETGATIVFSAVGALGIDDTATVTVTTGVADEDIRVYFQQEDGAPADADPLWEIEPIRIVPGALPGDKDIIFSRTLCVQPDDFWRKPFDESTDPNLIERNPANTETAANFITLVDVFQITTTGTEVIIEDPIFFQNTDLDSDRETSAVALITDDVNGLFRIRTESGNTTPRIPERVKVNYLAGLPRVDLRMDTQLARAIINYANTILGTWPCPLDNPADNKFNDALQDDPVSPRYVDNPLGTKRGAIQAWRFITRRANLRAGHF